VKKNRTQINVIILILVGALAGMTSLFRPNVLPVNGPAVDFSAERAMEHVSAIAQAPHPTGSAEIEQVREYIISELEALGLSPEIQETSVAVPRGTTVIASEIKNIIVKISGSNPSKAILLDAHYDTRMMTPGASDCSSCVATVLETTRAFLEDQPLQNDIILLFTDNEEYGGGLGAAAFVEKHPWADEVGLVLNFEGVGSTGPSILFETGPDSGWAIKDWSRVASHPVGQSWFQEIFQRTPIGTDMNWFINQGISGMNFGFWSDSMVYHAATDTPQTIDSRSIQHQGSYALELTKHFGNLDLNSDLAPSGDAVYFTLLPGLLIHYPVVWAVPLVGLISIMMVVIAGFGIRSKQISLRGALKGLGGFLLSLIASSGLATGIWMGVTQLHGEYQAQFTFRSMVYNAHFYVYGFAALAVAIAALILVLQRQKNTVMDLYFGALLFFWLMALVTSILTPGFSYLFTWPLFFSVLAFGWVLRQVASRKDNSWNELALTIGALPGIIIFTPSLYIMFQFALAPMIGALAFLVSLLLGLLIPQIDMFTKTYHFRLSWVTLAIFLIFLVTGSLTVGFNAEHPRPNGIAYLLDADSGEATWFSGGTQQDSWTRQFFTTEPEHGAIRDLFPIGKGSGFPIMYSAAQSIELKSPTMEMVDDQTTGDVRKLQLNLSSPRGAPVIMLDVKPYDAVQAVILDGKRIDTIESEREIWSLTYYAVSTDGFEVILEIEPSQPINIQISDQTWYMPPDFINSLGIAIQPRPEDMMPMPNFDYGTVVVKTLRID